MRITKTVAERVAEKLREHFTDGAFTVYEPGFHDDELWTIVCEEGAHEWTYQAGEVLRADAMARGYWISPKNHWCLAIYSEVWG